MFVFGGICSGNVSALVFDCGDEVFSAGPSTRVAILGLDGAPQAGDKFSVYIDEREAKQIAMKRSLLQREQSVRTQKYV